MSSRLNVKQSKRDRPRSSDKIRRGKRDGTPEKPTTPSASDTMQEEGRPGSSKNVIMNPEIEALAIKPGELQKVREPRPPSDKRKSPAVMPVVVRKLKPASELEKPTPRMVTVARPAPHDAPLKPIDYTGGAGARFDNEGNILPHSILGSVEEFKQQALQQGDIPVDLAEVREVERVRPTSCKYEKKRKVSRHPKQESVDESNALQNWQRRMRERRKQQGHLSKLLDKPPEHLVMNQADSYRKTQELRYIIDRTIPTMDYGKGYRIGSEFWKQQERIGNDLTGLHMTLSQTEKGYPVPIEHIGVPKTVLEEKGTLFHDPRTPLHKPWHRTPFLSQRTTQLQSVMNELDPHKPELVGLEIVGRKGTELKLVDAGDENEVISEGGMTDVEEQKAEFREMENMDPLRNIPDVHPAPIFGPSISFAGQAARWTGDSYSFNSQVGLEARVTFETFAGRRHTSFLEITNDGTTAVYFDWKKLHKPNPFELNTAKVQRFYFNTSSGVILPGENIKFPFVFKSPNAGVFSEQWEFQTRPVVCGGAALVVNLRGVALQEDKYEKQRSEVERDLGQKQAETIVRHLLDGLLDGIRTPARSPSPVDAYITNEEIFTNCNEGLHYHNETVTELNKMYLELFPEEEREEAPEWNLSVATLKQMVMEKDEDEEGKQEMLQRINKAVITMAFPPFNPVQQQMYTAGYQVLSEMVDSMVSQSMWIRNILGMPDKDMDDIQEADGRKGSKGKNEVKEKKSAKDSKSSSKSSGKESGRDSKAGKPGTGNKRPATREKTPPTSGPQSPMPDADPILDEKYRDKLYTQTYMLVTKMVDKMTSVFETIQQAEGGPKLPKLY